ncbi:prolyl aminopeptidase [Endozoicomonas sp. SCSIO W0465]|uniref:prolyl aminopeptidase n=1 Tax=Endozoicomonas sp. SCSIO W0465 TaxID=2918516 RepID=UPI002075CEEA|nr:prolyl aminopeptidase [Endozoicomonas sp. SCSIO W0465]USE35354.1 prolyl aminopeptidase [Endozoicomonas sp. SCSIO W0465]
MRTLYPAIKPYATRHLQVDDIHEVYIEECGSQDGIPVLFVHGGPGAGCTERDRRFFDPEKYRIVLFDQRGCGRSRPHAELEQNNTPLLIDDMELIRKSLGVEQWLVFGGSWGSTLSLLYAQAHPKRVSGLVVRGVFLSRSQDLDWLYKNGASRVFPDHWAHFLELIPESERGDLLEAYYQRLFGEDELARMNAAKHWSLWEGNTATLRPNHELVDHFADPHLALSLSRIECHYFRHNSFITPNQIIDKMNLISAIPGVIVHGRYDMICPLDNAQTLADHWPEANLQIIRDAGHASCEPGIVDALVRATDDFARRLSP